MESYLGFQCCAVNKQCLVMVMVLQLNCNDNLEPVIAATRDILLLKLIVSDIYVSCLNIVV